MERVNGVAQDELTMDVVIDGVKLIVVARRMENEEWLLSVLNEYGIFTNWVEYFATAQLAMDTGLKAIETEGIEEFVSVEGFEYKFDETV